MLLRVTDPDDDRIAGYRDIRERDLVKNRQQFIAEGKTVLQVMAAQQRFKLHSMLVLENRLAGVRNIIDSLPDSVPVYITEQSVMDSIAGFPMHRGLLGIGEVPADIDAIPDEAIIGNWKTVIVLAGLSNHDNVGAVFRNAAAFGADAVLIDSGTCDPLYRKAIRVSVGGVFKVPFFRFHTTEAIISLLKHGGMETYALSPQGTVELSCWEPPQRAAILLGTEGEGLSPNLLNTFQSLRVEMHPGFDSLNVATTSGIVLHHLTARPRNL